MKFAKPVANAWEIVEGFGENLCQPLRKRGENPSGLNRVKANRSNMGTKCCSNVTEDVSDTTNPRVAKIININEMI